MTTYMLSYIALQSKPFIMKYIIFLGLALSFIGCNRQPQQEVQIPKEQKASLSALHAAYGLKESSSPDIPSFQKALSGGIIFKQVKAGLDFDKVKLLTSVKENTLIYIVPFLQGNRFYAVKAINAKSLLVQDELLVVSKMQDDKNGTTGILKNGEALQIEFRNGKPVIKDLSVNEYKAHFMQDWPNIDPSQASSFCQRQSSQSYGQCFTHEVEEFCNSFISCLALTHPGVQIVIGLACSCYTTDPRATVTRPEDEPIISPVEPDQPLEDL